MSLEKILSKVEIAKEEAGRLKDEINVIAVSKVQPLIRIKKVLDSNTYILGNEVNKFEKSFSKYIGTKYSVGVSSGTDALILALKSLRQLKNMSMIL